MTRRVFVSAPTDESLDESERDFKSALLDRIAGAGYTPELFFDPTGRSRVALGPWSDEAVDRVLRRCTGTVVLGLCRWNVRHKSRGALRFATEYNHYEAAASYTIGLPMLVILDQSIEQRGVFDPGGGQYLVRYRPGSGAGWLDEDQFRRPFDHWRRTLRRRCDVFLGYCSSSTAVAGQVKTRLLEQGATVLDWQVDFQPGTAILDQIAEAARQCSAGIFLFTKDDQLSGDDSPVAPRDNVVFEAGYFAHAKGHDRMLIVLEAGAKMPADLGGKIFVPFEDRAHLEGLVQPIRSFLKNL